MEAIPPISPTIGQSIYVDHSIMIRLSFIPAQLENGMSVLYFSQHVIVCDLVTTIQGNKIILSVRLLHAKSL